MIESRFLENIREENEKKIKNSTANYNIESKYQLYLPFPVKNIELRKKNVQLVYHKFGSYSFQNNLIYFLDKSLLSF